MHIHHLKLFVTFLQQSWYGRDKKMPTTGHRLVVQSPFACPHITLSNFGIFKDLIIIFVIALSIDNQWIHMVTI